MFTYFERQKNKLIAWFFKHAESSLAARVLSGISFSESIFFPIPTIAFFVPMLMAQSKRWFSIASYVTYWSVVGGVIGYFIGSFFFDIIGKPIIDAYHLQEELTTVTKQFNDNAFLVTFIGAFTPIPYKVIVLAAGFLKVNFAAFVLGSILGRSLQFFLIGYVMGSYGEKITRVVLKYFNALFVLGILILLYVFLT